MDIKRYKYVGVLVGGVAAGAILGAGVLNANAATPGSPGSHGTSSVQHGGAPGETMLTGADAAKARAAALKAVPGGTVERIETDSGDAVYEAHVTKSDGSDVTVKFDKAFKVTAVEAGMGN
jgi:hypothetical protein